MKTLVTGATGFVGGHLVDELLRRGRAVRALVRDPLKARALKGRGVEVVIGDIRNPAIVEEALGDVSIVQHCAAAVGHFSKKEIYDTNWSGVQNLVEACRRRRGKRLVFVSTLNVLGTRHLDPASEDLPYRYSRDPAADVKIDAERMVLAHGASGSEVVIIRPGFIYGPGDTRNLPKLADAIARGKFVFMGSRENVVPIVHIDDVVQALILAAETPAARGRIYNITDGSRTTIGEVADYLARLQGVPAPKKVLPYALPYLACVFFEVLGKVGLRKRPGPVTRPALRFLGTSRFVDITRARNELGYCPRVDFRDGMAAAWQQVQQLGVEAVHESAAVS